jgi:15-cis-phytoene synthase/lycopene beta-cyclase
VLGPSLFRIPIEELFFFFIQTYLTSLVYLILSKPTFYPVYLIPGKLAKGWILRRVLGQLALMALICLGVVLVTSNRNGAYMGLILIWAGPFLLLLW